MQRNPPLLEIPCGRPGGLSPRGTGIGPNVYNFDDNVLYEIHVATGRDLKAGKPTISYQFEFNTTYKNDRTILVSYLGVVQPRCIADATQNLVQTYTVTKSNWHSKTGPWQRSCSTEQPR